MDFLKISFSFALACTLAICIKAQTPPVSHLRPGIEMAANPSKSNRDLMLTLKNPMAPILNQFKGQHFPSRGKKLEAITKAMKQATKTWHAPVLNALKHLNVDCECFWMTNQILVKNATPAVEGIVRQLGLVENVESERIIPLLPTMNPRAGEVPTGPEWGVKKIGAEEAWKETRGEGVIIAVIDTGVRGTHNALRSNYVGAENNGWFDPILNTTTPSDNNGHGTHCAGTICGTTGTGVAPGAKWMACRGCDVQGCPERALIACGQWVLCPTDPQGNNPDCSKAPHIVSNSWGGRGGETWFNHVISAWNAAGIIGIFAIGNEGPTCGSAGSPGDQPGVISVGSTSVNDTISTFSSRGPKKVPDGRVAPLVVAPGEDINSAGHTGDNSYHILSGTSMSTPHVAGAAALILARNPGISLAQLEILLYSTTQQQLTVTGPVCQANVAARSVYPNDVTGYGRIDLNRAFIQLANIQQLTG